MAATIDPRSAVRAESIRAHLRELLDGYAFSTSPKLSRFLEFTIERTLAGESDALKEYRLGVEIYGRPPSYDPRTDPIVRVEARRRCLQSIAVSSPLSRVFSRRVFHHERGA